MNSSNGNTRIIAFLVVLLFVILVARLWQLQIIKGKEFRDISFENRLRIEKIPSPRGIIYDRNGVPLVKNSPYFSVTLTPEMIDDEDIEDIADFLIMDPKELYRIIERWEDSLEPIRLKDGLSFKEVAYIEARLSDYPALSVDVEQTRHYLYGEVGSHLIGYLGKLNPTQIGKETFKDVPRQALIGQWGAEKLYDGILRGIPGRRIIEVDALGRRLRKISEEPPVKGTDIYLSIDINLQKKAEEEFGDRVGALVALKPATGEVLGLVSKPSFDPNLFARGISYKDWLRLAEDKRFPMLNRAFQSQYPPGSTFKIITAAAALETEAVKQKDSIFCSGVMTHGRWTFRCWKRGGHGIVSFYRALVESCDVYFYQAGGKAGIDSISDYARRFGLGKGTDIGLVKEKTGLVPDREWKKRVRDEPWYPGETYNIAIGQGFMLATPAQLARMVSVIANGGYLNNLSIIRTENPSAQSHKVELSEDTIKVLKKALRGVVKEEKGTGRAAMSQLTEISGKTGTAQVIAAKDEIEKDEEKIPYRFRDHAWFVAYAPKDEAEIALSVFVEHGGHGGSAAAPIAKAAIEAYMETLNSSKTVEEVPDGEI